MLKSRGIRLAWLVLAMKTQTNGENKIQCFNTF